LLLVDTQTFSAKVSLNHIALYVVDLKISTSFYHDIVGLDTIPEPFHDGRHTWFNIGPKPPPPDTGRKEQTERKEYSIYVLVFHR
jgi:catechol 2,3-dioxygenase-like lactoylglutathione lyase family enzyme